MANFVPKMGLHNNLPSTQEGSFLITTDNKEIYVDTTQGRVLISSGRQEVEFIRGTQTSDTSDWTGVTKDNSLYVGKMIVYQLPRESTLSASSLNLTLADGSKTGKIYLRRQGTGIVTRHYPVDSIIFLVYDGTYWRTDGDYNTEPVSSVNGKTGNVNLTASDVGALPSDTYIPIKTSDLTNDSGYITQADVVHQVFNGDKGIEVTSAGKVQHINDVTPVSTYPTGTTANASGGTITVRDFQYDQQGHITSSQIRTITLSQTPQTLSDLNGISTITTDTISAPLNLEFNKSGTSVTVNGSINAASTSSAGIVQLSSSTGSTSNSYAATPAAVKAAYDLANTYSGTVKSITPGDGLVNAATGDDTPITGTGTIQMVGVTTSSTTSTSAPPSQGSFTVIDDIDTNSFGQVTNINTKTVTLPPSATYEFADTYNTTTNKGATVATVTNAINALNVSAIAGAASKTITSISETSGKISATYSDISIAPSQINAAIPNSKLATTGISIAGTQVALDGSISASTLRSNLGLSQVLRFVGMTSANIIDGTNTIPTDLGIANYSPTIGDVIIDSSTNNEYVWIKGDGFLTGRWELLGSDSSFKTVQDTVASPITNGKSTEFIDTISQNANGVITATKKAIPTASTATAGLMTSEMVSKLASITSGATANTGTVQSITILGTTDQIVVDNTNAITNSGTRTISLAPVGTSGTWGETTQQTPAHSSAFNIPYFVTDEYGRVTSAGTTTVKLPASDNTDKKVQQLAAITTNGEYPLILAYSTATTSVTNAVNKTSTLTYNPGTRVLTAPTFSGNFSGTATKVSHKLTIGSYEFDGSADVTIPIYAGATL